MDFESLLKFGEVTERKIAAMLMRQGYTIFPMYSFGNVSGVFPQLINNAGKIKTPDILAFRDGKTIFVECKKKSGLNSSAETGIDWRLWRSYLKCWRHTNIPVIIIFQQLGNNSYSGIYKITVEQLDSLKPRYWDGYSEIDGSYVMHPMALWSIGELKQYKVG